MPTAVLQALTQQSTARFASRARGVSVCARPSSGGSEVVICWAIVPGCVRRTTARSACVS
eukprot:10186411-Lingulodinium_polyedra.AAC.1